MPNANHICFLCIQINGHRSVAPSLPKIFKTIPTFACRQRTPLHFICVMNTWRWLCVVLLWSYRECYVHLAHFRSTTTMQFSKERFTAPSSFGCWVTPLPLSVSTLKFELNSMFRKDVLSKTVFVSYGNWKEACTRVQCAMRCITACGQGDILHCTQCSTSFSATQISLILSGLCLLGDIVVFLLNNFFHRSVVSLWPLNTNLVHFESFSFPDEIK